MIEEFSKYQPMIPYVAIGIIIAIFAISLIRKKFVSVLGLDEIYVKKEDCTKCNKEIYNYIDGGRKEILDKLDANTKMISEMKTSHDLFLEFIKEKMGH